MFFTKGTFGEMKKFDAVDIEVWRLTPRPSGQARSHPKGISPRFLGLLGSLLLHAFVLHSVLAGARNPKYRLPEIQGAGSAKIHSELEPSDTLVLINLPSASMKDTVSREYLASAGLAPREALVTLISPDPLPQLEITPDEVSADPDAKAPVPGEDSASRALLFGRYTGQIDARIERVWRRPRSPVTPVDPSSRDERSGARHVNLSTEDADTFNCEVRIMQDRRGNVQEVQLLRCNGSAAWQHSLIMAILTASPLPAPPNPAVFAEALTITFEGRAYTSGVPADDYESVRRSVADAGPARATHVSIP
jgi:hypothetical protein